MSSLPVARSKRASYENLTVDCPLCGEENIFNRASDLRTFEPIGGRDVVCQNGDCRRSFRVVGDSVSSAHEMLIWNCYELLERKHYMSCILSLALSYEVFFSLFFRVELLFKPFAAEPEHDIAALNRLSEELAKQIQKHTFAPMRALFLRYVVDGRSPRNLHDAVLIIDELGNNPGVPKDSAIDVVSDTALVPFLKALKATSINTLRNHVVHKRGYRPTRTEVEAALAETRSILFPLTARLKLYDDINYYMRKL